MSSRTLLGGCWCGLPPNTGTWPTWIVCDGGEEGSVRHRTWKWGLSVWTSKASDRSQVWSLDGRYWWPLDGCHWWPLDRCNWWPLDRCNWWSFDGCHWWSFDGSQWWFFDVIHWWSFSKHPRRTLHRSQGMRNSWFSIPYGCDAL